MAGMMRSTEADSITRRPVPVESGRTNPPPRPHDGLLSLQRTAGNRAVATLVGQSGRTPVQRLLLPAEQVARRAEILALEARVDAAVAGLPGWVQASWNRDHPLLNPIQHAHAQAVVNGIDDNAAITAQVAALGPRVAAFELHRLAFLAEMQNIQLVYGPFQDQLDPKTTKLMTNLSKKIYAGTATSPEFAALKRAVDGDAAAISHQAMQEARQGDRTQAIAQLGRYINAGFVAINPLNSFYESEYDLAEDDFGAAATMHSEATTGKMQWLREWEFHIHGHATRAPAGGGAVTGFTIKIGPDGNPLCHAKPSGKAREVGVSITILSPALLAQVVNDSAPAVVRWAGSGSGAQALRGKKR